MTRRINRLAFVSFVKLALVVCVGFAGTPANAVDFATGPLPLEISGKPTIALTANDELVVEGVVFGDASAGLLLRIDDDQSTDYQTRVNVERQVPPGPFSLRLAVSEARTPSGRALNLQSIRLILFASFDGNRQVLVKRFATEPRRTVTLPVVAAAAPASFGVGPLPIDFGANPAIALSATDQLEAEGTIEGDQHIGVVLRVDDGRSMDYATRYNDEHKLPPGPFNIRVAANALKTPSGRTIDPRDIRRVILAVYEGSANVTVSKFGPVHTAASPPAEAPTGKSDAPKLSDTPSPDTRQAMSPRTFGKGQLPITLESDTPLVFANDDRIEIDGLVTGDVTAGVVFRIDDGRSHDYPSRFNDERTLPPGPFKLRIGVAGLKSPSGRIIDHRDVRRVIFSQFEGAGRVTVERFESVRGVAMPEGVTAFALGADDAPLFPGFERIGPSDRRIEGRQINTVRRPAPDPLVANGLKGVQRVRLDVPSGRKRITLWLEDPGEWELLPHPLERRIRINGRDVLVEKLTFEAWIKDRYLRTGVGEHGKNDDAWTAYGQHRGDPRSFDVDVGADGLTIELPAKDRDAQYLSGIIVEPEGSTAGQDHVQGLRAEWYRTKYVVTPGDDGGDGSTIPVALGSTNPSSLAPITANAAPDTGTRLSFTVTSSADVSAPSIRIEPPASTSGKLSVKSWAGMQRLERLQLSGNLLGLRDNRLVADVGKLPLRAGQPRTYELWVTVPKAAVPGKYQGAVTFSAGSVQTTVPIEIDVLPVSLPDTPKPAGFYLDGAPHLTWFAPLVVQRGAQIACDLRLMHGYGLTGSAPPSSVPRRGSFKALVADMQIATAENVAPGWLIYNPANTVRAQEGDFGSAELLAKVDKSLRLNGVKDTVWSVIDEPSNPDQQSGQLEAWIKELRRGAPEMKLAGHLNAPHDEAFVPLLDTVIVNVGFGIDANRLAKLAAQGRDVWLYNTWRPRLSAGLWMWGTAAKHYVQWHGRLPTADPFDPLDGREADAQMIYPAERVCEDQPDIHRDLLKAAEGVVDQRWLAWLETQTTPEAKSLAREAKALAEQPWKDAATMTGIDFDNLRNRIMALASKSN